MNVWSFAFRHTLCNTVLYIYMQYHVLLCAAIFAVVVDARIDEHYFFSLQGMVFLYFCEVLATNEMVFSKIKQHYQQSGKIQIV